MRPRRLEMEGFLAYRKPAEVDFAEADLFVLSGATGSGKSSVIDAMIFALYGTIPRLDDRRSVAPVITALSDRARVAFEFSIGEDIYTVGRLVERTGTGAKTTEARLQRGDEVLASGADDVTEAVTVLLGLSFEHFTKAVVLPQGAFADFLTDKPKDRQALLRALLDLGLYERVKVIANERAAVSRGRMESIEESLAKLDVPNLEDVEVARAELQRLEAARGALPGRLQDLEALRVLVEQARSRVAAGAERMASLEKVALPPDLISLEERRSTTADALEAASKALEEHRARLNVLEKRAAGFPPGAELAGWVSAYQRLDRLSHSKAELGLSALETEVGDAEARLAESRQAVDHRMAAHAAHSLREGLASGLPCPVCLQTVVEPPRSDGEVASSLRQSQQAHSRLEDEARTLRQRLAEAEGEAKQLDLGITELAGQLADAPERVVVDRDLAAMSALAHEIEVAAREEERLANCEKVVRDELEAIVSEAAGLRDALLLARDAVAGEKPPPPGHDMVESWLEFDHWRDQRLTSLTTETHADQRSLESAIAALEDARSDFTEWLGSVVPVSAESPETDLALAVERLSADIGAMSGVIESAVELGSQLEEEKLTARVASTLGTHLRSNNFEAWVMEEALDTLVEGANHLLGDLSSGAYSLRVANRQFEVTDHRNADVTRSTRSLSGGEVFLVSLSLALSMAGQLAELAGVASRLESVFLDEGFGSLDQESLDIVASVLDELVGQGRTVGVVTHVKDLSERIPVRYDVSKGPVTSIVKRIAG
jgi:DNA repair protein SbcC/Rad50